MAIDDYSPYVFPFHGGDTMSGTSRTVFALTKNQQIYIIGRLKAHGDATHIPARHSKRAHSLDQIWGLVGRLYRIIQEAPLFCGVSVSDVYKTRFLSSL